MKLVSSRRLFCTSLVATTAWGLVACGGDDGGGTPTPEGEHYTMAVDSVTTPASVSQANEYGLDLDGDGNKDNQLGMVLSVLGGMGLEVQPALTEAIDQGSVVLLADVQTTSFTSTAAAGLSVYLGANPSPAPCVDENDMTCRLHLAGTGSFDISADSPTDTTLAGPFVNGTFRGGPGTITLQLALTDAPAISLNLIGARAQLSDVSATGIGEGILAGAITEDDINNEVLPAVTTLVAGLVAEDCTPAGADCGCTPDSSGEGVLDLFDDNMDCEITLAEIQGNAIVGSLLAPDVVINGEPSLSLGVGMTAVAGTFTLP
ncbi:MAG: hypothetical protein R2939_05810 [Kofleriaceae bacterium]